jgi:hypothetical protein
LLLQHQARYPPPLVSGPPPMFHPMVNPGVPPILNPVFPHANQSMFPMYSTANSIAAYPPVLQEQAAINAGPINFFQQPNMMQQQIPSLQDHKKSNSDLAKRFPAVWSGAIILKNGAYVTNMYLISGLVDTLLHDSSTSECPVLKITQRLRLDLPDKLQELSRRVDMAGRNGCSVLLAAPASAEVGDVNNIIQQRPLNKLCEFLQEKKLAAVIPLPPGSSTGLEKGVLHAFPKYEFANEFLQKEAPELAAQFHGDHLLIIIMRESTTTQSNY